MWPSCMLVKGYGRTLYRTNLYIEAYELGHAATLNCSGTRLCRSHNIVRIGEWHNLQRGHDRPRGNQKVLTPTPEAFELIIFIHLESCLNITGASAGPLLNGHSKHEY